MSKKPKKKLTPLQENRLLKISIGLIIFAMLWLLMAPGTGVYALLQARRKTADLEAQIEQLLIHNEKLQAEVDRIHTDPAYLERIAREKYGMLKKNEQVFDFSTSDQNSSP